MLDVSKIAIQIASEFTGSKAFKAAETSAQKLERTVKNLAKSLGIAFSATALANYSKRAVKAFAEDENAARSLGMTLKNLNIDYVGASQSVNLYISSLEKQTGVLDDELRPAMDRFLRATSSITESQKLLNLALDISAGTGKDLTAVSQGLQKAYLGNNVSLGRLGVGLSKAELTGSSFLEIQERLTDLFAGQAKSAADGYLGSMNKLTIASNNAKEIIGEDLLNSFALLSGPDGISKSTQQMEDFATAVGDTIYGVSVLISKIQGNKLGGGILGTFGDILSNLQPFALLRGLGKSSAATPAQSPGQRAAIDKINKDALKYQKQQNDLKKIDNANTARKIVLTGDQLALQELEKKFDVERVNLSAAMNQATDGETKMRLLSLLAIHDQNTALAGMIKKANEAENAFAALIEALRATIRSMLDSIMPQVKQLQVLTGPSTPIDVQREVIRNKLDLAMPDISALQSRLGQFSNVSTGGNSPTIVVNVGGSVTTERDLVNAITQGIYNNQASGIPINYSTVY
jgi:hypothetical protein